jgi:hypothetical protein
LGVTGPTGPVFRIPEVPSNWNYSFPQENPGAPGDIYYGFIPIEGETLSYNYVLYMYYKGRDTGPDAPAEGWKIVPFGDA